MTVCHESLVEVSAFYFVAQIETLSSKCYEIEVVTLVCVYVYGLDSNIVFRVVNVSGCLFHRRCLASVFCLYPMVNGSLEAGEWTFTMGEAQKKIIKYQINSDGCENKRSHGLVVRTLDSESSNPSSNLGGTFFIFLIFLV